MRNTDVTFRLQFFQCKTKPFVQSRHTAPLQHARHVSAPGALDIFGRDTSGDGSAAMHKHARQGENGTTEGRDLRTGYQEKSVGEVPYN